MWGKFPMLNFSRRASTLGCFFPPDSQKVLKIAHFCASSHIGGVGGGPKTYGPQNIVGHGPWKPKSRISDLLGPHNNFFRKKNPERSNYCTPRHICVHVLKKWERKKARKSGLVSPRRRRTTFCRLSLPSGFVCRPGSREGSQCFSSIR